MLYEDELDEGLSHQQRMLKELHLRRSEDELYALLDEALKRQDLERDGQ
jgi:hypothetical protein